jgi:hypothetical protein
MLEHKSRIVTKSPVMSGFLDLPEVLYASSVWYFYREVFFPHAVDC